MMLRVSRLRPDPYLGYDAPAVARQAAFCLQCPPPASCTLACPRETDIPRVMRLAGQAACEGLSLGRWFWAARICNAICDAHA